MGKINVEGLEDNTDPFYRYQMSKIEVTYEKNKTVVQNLDQVANDLGREVEMLVVFFKKYFGANFVSKNSKYVSSKKVTAAELQESLKEFIEYGVLCPKCRLPETHILIGKSLGITCDCCGHEGKIDTTLVNSKVMKDIFSNMEKTKSKKGKKGKN